ncbi:hypothetical protein AWE51_03860 [Aquimarina aggregata]|uniref:HTH araC/xylS-type domain-containing protein n=2 Tax=Aquimarina TaxID=290174 RepID=A0A163CN88_9FLAO|nr:helix-turn-helix domain-containing protein [Aquimarina aggregata]KZS42590.1 hypothetical protein AWE51_03860 [Aquimarina aggregata]
MEIGQSDVFASVATGIGTFQGFLIAINLLFLRKGSKKANLFLFALLLAQSLIIFQNFIVFSGLYYQFAHITLLFFSFNGLIGPLFFFYTLFLISPDRGLKWYDFIHLSFFFYLLFFTGNWDYINLPAYQKIEAIPYIYSQENYTLSFTILISVLLKKSITLAYVLIAFRLINTKIKTLKNNLSDTTINYLRRFKLITYIFGLCIITHMSLFIIDYNYHIKIYKLEIYIHILNSLFLIVIAIITIQQPERLLFVLQKNKVTKLKFSKKQVHLDELLDLMLNQKPYLNPELKLHDLASLMNAPSHTLSDQINKELGLNFYDFINQYRVNEFKKRVVLPEYKNLTLIAIAHDVGFNSKTSFNRIFKKHTSITPSEFLTQKQVSTSEIGSKLN